MADSLPRVCTRCGSSFLPQRPKLAKCQACMRAYQNELYRINNSKERRAFLQAQKKRRMLETRQYIWDYLKAHPCVLCGQDDPVVLEFDHIDRSSKLDSVGRLVSTSLESVKREIDKCRVLCANCHRKHSAEQLGWYADIVK